MYQCGHELNEVPATGAVAINLAANQACRNGCWLVKTGEEEGTRKYMRGAGFVLRRESSSASMSEHGILASQLEK